MSLSIYTYSNPYEINQLPFWGQVKDTPHFCVSQTMVNGLLEVYPQLRKGQLSTVENLINTLFGSWNDNTRRYIEQYAVIDRLIEESLISEKHKKSLKFNKKNIVDCIRLLIELKIDISELDKNKLSVEQKYVIDLYKKALQSADKELFSLPTAFTKEEIEEAIKFAIEKGNLNRKVHLANQETVIFHGVHQFTPLTIQTIEAISKYKQVILLFNYQKQYKNIYQTWMDIYSILEEPIKCELNNEFKPTSLLSLSYEGNTLGDQIGHLVEGRYEVKEQIFNNLEIIEFDNITEFASYVGRVYQNALLEHQKQLDTDESLRDRSVLYYMKEQFYAADAKVNDILKLYYPEQFGERHFLAYPIGHFFVALADMWNIEEGTLIIEDMNSIVECLNAGITYEEVPGALVSTFNVTKLYFERENTISGINEQLKRLSRQINKNINKKSLIRNTNNNKDLTKLGYFNVTAKEIEALIVALEEIETIAKMFYEECEEQTNDFSKFYMRIKEFIQNKIVGNELLEREFEDVIERLISRLSEADDITTQGTFACLKETMSYYLKQEDDKNKRANWIVRDFEQIDGDVLKSSEQNENTCYHFCTISDIHMNVSEDARLPWPLNMRFFEYAYEAKGWQEQIYIKSMKEYKNFKRYALVYGLLFNRVRCKLSYIKHEDDQVNEIYYLLKLLGIKIKPYLPEVPDGDAEKVKYIQIEDVGKEDYSVMDYYRWNVCKYKFALETLVEQGVHYKEKFMIFKYLEILIENKVREELAGRLFMEVEVKKALEEAYEEFVQRFQFAIEIDQLDIIAHAYQYIITHIIKDNRFPNISDYEKEHMEKKKEFIYLSLSHDDNQDENILRDKLFGGNEAKIKRTLTKDKLGGIDYIAEVDEWCKFCANREICLESYKSVVD